LGSIQNGHQMASHLLLGNVFLPLEGADSKDSAERRKASLGRCIVWIRKAGGTFCRSSRIRGAGYYMVDGFFKDSETVALKFETVWHATPRYVGPFYRGVHEGSDGSWEKVSELRDDPRLTALPINICGERRHTQPPISRLTD